jgi:hypothetical protein
LVEGILVWQTFRRPVSRMLMILRTTIKIAFSQVKEFSSRMVPV